MQVVGGPHASAGKQADTRENAKPHALPRFGGPAARPSPP